MHFSSDMALFDFDQDSGQVESFLFFSFFERKASRVLYRERAPSTSQVTAPVGRSGMAFRRPASMTTPTDGRGQKGKRLPRRRKGRGPVTPACRSLHQ
jgi:hypothetical protein